MRRTFLVLPLFGFLLLASQAAAAPKDVDPVVTFPKKILVQLTDDQKTKLKELLEELGPKLQEVDSRRNAIMTPERQKAAADARKKAVSDGLKGEAVEKAVNKALNLSADEKGKLAKAEAAQQVVIDEIIKRKTALLTDEQKALLKPKK
jgi:hypothetical protein